MVYTTVEAYTPSKRVNLQAQVILVEYALKCDHR